MRARTPEYAIDEIAFDNLISNFGKLVSE